MHRDLLAGAAKGTRHGTLTPALPIVDGDSYMAGFHDEHGNGLPAEYSRYTAVFVRKSGKWYVTAFRSLPQVKVTAPH